MVRVGIIGCGKIAQMRHIPEYRKNPCAEIRAVYDADPARAGEVAAGCGARVCGSCRELLESPDIDAVSVLTPNCTHAEISIAALKAGKHVLCEKPMAAAYADCMEMAQTAEEEGRLLMIAHNQRLAPAHVKARELLSQGIIGKPLMFSTAFTHGGPEKWSVDGRKSWFMDKGRSCFGAMADLGVHKLDLICYLLDSPVAKVSAPAKARSLSSSPRSAPWAMASRSSRAAAGMPMLITATWPPSCSFSCTACSKA